MAAWDDGHRGEPSVAAVCRAGDLDPNPWIARDRVSPYTCSSSVERSIFDIQLTTPEGSMTDATAAINATNLGCSITCKDLEASIRFYRDAIGFAVAQTFENEGKVVAALVAAGDCRIVLNQDDGRLGWDRIKGQGFYVQINVAGAADVDAAAARIKAAGGALLSEPADRPWGARMFQFNDLDGFKLGVSTPLVR
jgi:predicted enzyme related to lactoylglutathione lyase